MKTTRYLGAPLLVLAATLVPCPQLGTAAGPIASAETNWDGLTVEVMSVARKGNANMYRVHDWGHHSAAPQWQRRRGVPSERTA